MRSNLSIKEKVTKVSEIPKDVMLGVPVMTILGNMEIHIENYGGIIEFTDTLMRIRVKEGQIIINGYNLNVEYYSNYDMKIHGKFVSIEFKH